MYTENRKALPENGQPSHLRITRSCGCFFTGGYLFALAIIIPMPMHVSPKLTMAMDPYTIIHHQSMSSHRSWCLVIVDVPSTAVLIVPQEIVDFFLKYIGFINIFDLDQGLKLLLLACEARYLPFYGNLCNIKILNRYVKAGSNRNIRWKCH